MANETVITIHLDNRHVVGSCNACLEKKSDHVWVMSFLNPQRVGMEVRLCYECMENFRKLADKVVDAWKFRDV